jgi:hypothetical protein
MYHPLQTIFILQSHPNLVLITKQMYVLLKTTDLDTDTILFLNFKN